MRSIFLFLLAITSTTLLAQTNIRGVINQYTAASGITCSNSILVSDAGSFSPGDKVLIVQMKGATIDLSNTASFGNITDYGQVGKYEMNEVSSIATGELFLTYTIENTYAFDSYVQVVRIPVYGDVLIDSTLTCQAWNGSTGGILALIAEGTVTLQADIHANEQGFRGGDDMNYTDSCPFGLSWNGYRTDTESGDGAVKGEGFAEVGDDLRAGRGKLANGGGGGNDHNAGGGGGSQGGAGGVGGERVESLFSCPGPGTGQSGVVPDHSNAANRIYLGGGGGAGHGNNGNSQAGGHGGGIIFIAAASIDGNGFTISANGQNGPSINGDGGSGGGAGGSLLLDIGAITSDFQVELKGGNGSNVSGNACTGPGGGGGGGVLRHTGISLPAGIFSDLAGGTAGTTTTASSPCYEESNGASNGETGLTVAEWPVNYSDEVFIANFAIAGTDTVICAGNTVSLFAAGGSSYSWSPADGLSDPTIADPLCTIETPTTYIVSVTNDAGCTDTAQVFIDVVPGVTAVAGPDTTLCGPNQIFFFASGGDTYSWSPTTGMTDSEIADPLVFVSTTTDYYVTVGNGVCSDIDTVSVTILPLPVLETLPDTTICAGETITLYVSGADTYSWWPADSVPCVDCAMMDVTPGGSTSFFVTGTNADGCTATISFEVKVEICNSIEELAHADIRVYPNPASTQIWIEWQDTNANSCVFLLTDMNGRIVQEEHLIAGNHIYMIHLNNIPSGNYMYTLASDKYQKTGTVVIE